MSHRSKSESRDSEIFQNTDSDSSKVEDKRSNVLNMSWPIAPGVIITEMHTSVTSQMPAILTEQMQGQARHIHIDILHVPFTFLYSIYSYNYK
jgi:hypothetical protein